MLGQYLNLRLSAAHEILTVYNSHTGNCKDFNSAKVDLTDRNQLEQVFKAFKPETVIHTAAISRPESCDALPKNMVSDVNVKTSKQLAELCDSNSCKMIYTSTDLVYDGNSEMMLREDSLINPVSIYAESKLEAEKEIKNTFDNFIILRTSLLYGIGLHHSINNFHITLNNFREGKKSRLFFDQYRTPLALHDAARLIAELLPLNLKSETINFGGSQRVSRTELAEILCSVCGFDKSLIEPISMNEIQSLHKVADVSMDPGKLHAFGLVQKSIEDSIREMFND